MALAPLAGQALTPVEAFTTAPDNIIPLIDRATRLDMVDYFNAGSSHMSRNNLMGDSRILASDPSSIKVQVTGAQTLRMVVLPAGSDTVVAVIYTTMTPVADSTVDLYSSDWKRLGNKNFEMPGLSQWLRKGVDRKKVDALLPLVLSECEYDPATLSFVFTNTTEEYLGKEEYAPLRPLLRNYLVYAFNPGKRALEWLGDDAANPLSPDMLP